MFAVSPVVSRAEESIKFEKEEVVRAIEEVVKEETKIVRDEVVDDERSSLTQVSIKMFLEGPYSAPTGLMSTALNDANLIPVGEPYQFLGYEYVGGTNFPFLDPTVFDVVGSDAIVDWVFVEFRNSADMAEVLFSRPALLQADGDVVDYDGASNLYVDLSEEYYVSVGHRNHLQAMTENPKDISQPIDFSTEALYGNDAAKSISGVQTLWSGDVNRDGMLKYTGAANDRDIILLTIGGVIPTGWVNGYFSADTNMNGVVKYTGFENDRDPILVNVHSLGGVNAVRHAQIIN